MAGEEELAGESLQKSGAQAKLAELDARCGFDRLLQPSTAFSHKTFSHLLSPSLSYDLPNMAGGGSARPRPATK